MRLQLDTETKVAILIDGDFTARSVPEIPMPEGAANAHFAALMAELQPILDRYLPIDRGVGGPAPARLQAGPRSAAMIEADLLQTRMSALQRELTDLAAAQASHDARMEDAQIVAGQEQAIIEAKMQSRHARVAALRERYNALEVSK